MSEASSLIVSAKPVRREHVPLGILYMVGATIVFAGNFPGVTQTMPLAVYLLLETNQEASFILSLVLLLVSLLVLVGLRHRWLGSA